MGTKPVESNWRPMAVSRDQGMPRRTSVVQALREAADFMAKDMATFATSKNPGVAPRGVVSELEAIVAKGVLQDFFRSATHSRLGSPLNAVNADKIRVLPGPGQTYEVEVPFDSSQLGSETWRSLSERLRGLIDKEPALGPVRRMPGLKFVVTEYFPKDAKMEQLAGYPGK